MVNRGIIFNANLPGAALYSRRARLWLRDASLGKRNASSNALVEPGTLFGFATFTAVIWIGTRDNVFFAVQLYHGSTAWLSAMFAFCIGMTLRIL